jgi:hypothetical protein
LINVGIDTRFDVFSNTDVRLDIRFDIRLDLWFNIWFDVRLDVSVIWDELEPEADSVK